MESLRERPLEPAGRAARKRPATALGSWLPVAAYCLLIFALSSIPAKSMPSGSWPDKLIHGVEYALLAIVVVRALLRGPPRIEVAPAMLVGLLAAVIFGVTDEWHQSFTPGRDSDFFDVVADGVGALLGTGLAALFYRPARRSAPAQRPARE